MSYEMVEELPPQVRKSFSYEDAELWMDYYNSECMRLHDDCSKEELIDKAYTSAWEYMESAKSSRFFKAQVVVEDVDVQGEVPIVSEYLKLAKSDMMRDGGIGIDKHSSRNVWTVWDVMEATDDKGRASIVIKGNFFRDKPMFDMAWNIFLTGRSQFSLGSYTSRRRVCDDAYKCVIEVVPEQWFEISIVDVGASPNTGVLDIHVPFGEGDFNPKNVVEGTVISLKSGEFCPIKFAYEGLKEALTNLMMEPEKEGDTYDCRWNLVWEEGFGAIFTGCTDNIDLYLPVIAEWSAGVFAHSIPLRDMNTNRLTIYMIPYSYFTALDETSIALLIIDEEEAIAQYDMAIEQAKRLGTKDAAGVVAALVHIRGEEAEHIEELYDIVHQFYALITEPSEIDDYPDGITLKNVPGDTTNVARCPSGQHSHSGISGCHDITRAHAYERGSAPEGKIDVTDEFIDVDVIKKINTPRLSQVVKTIAKALTSYSDEKVGQFMESSGGKEFALMLTELVNRKRQSEGSGNVKKETEIKQKVSEKMDTDNASELSALVTVIAALKSQVEHLSSMVMQAQNNAMEGQSQSGNISDAVTMAVDSITGSDGVDLGETAVGNADGTSVVTGSSDAEVAPGVEGEEVPAEGGTEEGAPEGEGEEDGEKEKPDFGGMEKAKGEPAKEKPEGESKEEPVKEESEEESEEEPTKEKTEEDEEPKKKTKESTGIAEVGPGFKGDEDRGEDEEAEKKKLAEKADASEISNTPCDSPGVIEGTPNIGGDGDIIGGQPAVVDSTSAPLAIVEKGDPKDAEEVSEGEGIDELEGAVSEKGTPLIIEPKAGDTTMKTGLEGWVAQSESLFGNIAEKGVSVERTPTIITDGPVMRQLKEVSNTQPIKSYEATMETGLEEWLALSKNLSEKGITMQIDDNPLETKISLKSSVAGVLIIPPVDTEVGTGFVAQAPTRITDKVEALWNAVGRDNETFSKIRDEVLQ